MIGLALNLLGSYWKPIAIAVAVAALLGGAYFKGRAAGSFAERASWLVKEQAREESEREARRIEHATLLVRVAKVDQIATEVIKVVEKIKVVTQTIVKRVEVYVPSDAPVLPAGWRLLHDAAARGVEPDPAPASGTDAPGTSAQDAARTVIENYGTYHEVATRLHSLQRYVSEVCLAPPEKSK